MKIYTQREFELLEAAVELITHTDYNNRNLTKKQEWLIDDLRTAVLKYYKGEERPGFRVYAGEIK